LVDDGILDEGVYILPEPQNDEEIENEAINDASDHVENQD